MGLICLKHYIPETAVLPLFFYAMYLCVSEQDIQTASLFFNHILTDNEQLYRVDALQRICFGNMREMYAIHHRKYNSERMESCMRQVSTIITSFYVKLLYKRSCLSAC